MASLSLFFAAIVVALVGWGVVKHEVASKSVPMVADKGTMEQQLKAKGEMKANGTVATGTDFDVELNAQIKELNSIDVGSDTQLTTLEKQK